MSDLISRQVAIDVLKKQQAYFSPQDEPLVYYEYRRAINAIENLCYIQPEIIRCKDCKHRPVRPKDAYYYEDIIFPDEECPCSCADPYYSWIPKDDWFCPNGERKED